MPTISVIVPVYNTEKYLRRCVDSILAQTFRDFELLLIDDGSTDSSPAICDEYAKQDSRVRVFHKENGGVTKARNIGIKESSGEWIMFCDADDEYKSFYVNVFAEKINNKYEIISASLSNSNLISKNEIINAFILERVMVGFYCNIYRKDFIINSYFCLDRYFNIGEDIIINTNIFLQASCIKAIVNDGYVINENFSSVTRTRTLNVEYEWDFQKELEKTVRNLYNDCENLLQLRLIRTYRNLLINGLNVPKNHPMRVAINQIEIFDSMTLLDRLTVKINSPFFLKVCLSIRQSLCKLKVLNS